jgi:hypothetical protein
MSGLWCGKLWVESNDVSRSSKIWRTHVVKILQQMHRQQTNWGIGHQILLTPKHCAAKEWPGISVGSSNTFPLKS